MLYAQVFQNITGSFWQKIKYRTRQEDISHKENHIQNNNSNQINNGSPPKSKHINPAERESDYIY